MKRSTEYKARLIHIIIILLITVSMQSVQAEFLFSEPMKVPNLNTKSFDGGGSLSLDGLEMYFVSSHPHGGNHCYSDIFVVTRATLEDPWSTPTKLAPPINTDGVELYPCISPDGLELYFTDGTSDCHCRPGGYGQSDIWVSTRTSKCDAWSEPENLGSNVNSPGIEEAPSISSDGLTLYFNSYPSTVGPAPLSEIYVTTRPTKHDPWGPAQKIGSPINSNEYDQAPCISPDNLSLYFTRGRWIWESSQYTYDVYVSKRSSNTAPWKTPVRFALVNSPLSEYGISYATGGTTIYFNRSVNWKPFIPSTFNATYMSMDLWQVEATPILDLNSDGIINGEDLAMIVDNWHTENTLCDVAPAPMGDGFVDIQDLTAIGEHLFEAFPLD